MKARLLPRLAALLPAIAAYTILYLQAFSVPYQDDYHAIVSFATDYQQLPGWRQKLLAIAVTQHNEYKLGFEHSVVAAELELTRHLNFSFLCAFGNLTLLPIAYLLWLTFPGHRRFAFVPVSCLFFSLTYWENLDWAMTGLQNSPVVLFSLLAIYWLASPSRARPMLACAAAALAAFTSANGFLLGPIGLLILLPRRAYARALLWCLSFVFPLVAYLYHFAAIPHPQSPYAYLTRPLFFLALLGGLIPSPWLAALLGLGIAAVLILALRTRFDRANPVAAYFVLWVLATAALVAWVRGAEGLAVVSRYSIYSSLVWLFCYAFLAHHLEGLRSPLPGKRFYALSLVGAIAFCVAADIHAYRKLGQRRRMVLDGIAAYCANPAVNSPMIDPRIARTVPQELPYERDTLTEARRKGIFTLECNASRQAR